MTLLRSLTRRGPFFDLFCQFFLDYDPLVFPFALDPADIPAVAFPAAEIGVKRAVAELPLPRSPEIPVTVLTCLLYTSVAAGDQGTVDIADVKGFEGDTVVERFIGGQDLASE